MGFIYTLVNFTYSSAANYIALPQDVTYKSSDGRNYVTVFADQNNIILYNTIEMSSNGSNAGNLVVTEHNDDIFRMRWSLYQELESQSRGAGNWTNGWRTSTQMMCMKVLPYVPELRNYSGTMDVDANTEFCISFYPRVITHLSAPNLSPPV